jgi:hypothetical protein
MLISQTSLNHGIYLSPDGHTLYASSATTVWARTYNPATGNIGGSPRTLVVGMRNGGQNSWTLITPQHRPDLLVVSHGSDGNFDHPSINPATARAIVKVFNISVAPSSGFNYASDG